MTNRIREIPAAAPTKSVNPKTPAMMARIRKVMVQLSIGRVIVYACRTFPANCALSFEHLSVNSLDV